MINETNKKEIIIQVKGLKKNFGSLEVLKGVDMEIDKGEVVVVIGPSGSGKSTFLRCLNLLEKPTAGDILFHGKSILSRDMKIDKYREKFGMVFQLFNLFENLSVLDNVTIGPRKVKKVSKAEADKKAMDLLKQVGLESKADAYPSQLSGGQKQRVAIARAMVNRPKILLADEPTGALDSRTSREVLDFLKELNQEGNTIIMITHDNSIAMEAKHVVRIHDGKINFNGDVKEYAAIIQAGNEKYLEQ